jgi:hypothetical protein
MKSAAIPIPLNKKDSPSSSPAEQASSSHSSRGKSFTQDPKEHYRRSFQLKDPHEIQEFQNALNSTQHAHSYTQNYSQTQSSPQGQSPYLGGAMQHQTPPGTAPFPPYNQMASSSEGVSRSYESNIPDALTRMNLNYHPHSQQHFQGNNSSMRPSNDNYLHGIQRQRVPSINPSDTPYPFGPQQGQQPLSSTPPFAYNPFNHPNQVRQIEFVYVC